MGISFPSCLSLYFSLFFFCLSFAIQPFLPALLRCLFLHLFIYFFFFIARNWIIYLSLWQLLRLKIPSSPEHYVEKFHFLNAVKAFIYLLNILTMFSWMNEKKGFFFPFFGWHEGGFTLSMYIIIFHSLPPSKNITAYPQQKKIRSKRLKKVVDVVG